MRRYKSIAMYLAVAGVITTSIPSNICAAVPPETQAAATEPAESLPSQTTAKLIQTFDSELQDASEKLPKSLTTARGIEYYVAFVEGIAKIDAPAAKIFARRLADVLAKHNVKLSDALNNLPKIPRDATEQPPLNRADNVRLTALVEQMLEPPESPFNDAKEAEPYSSMMLPLVETCAFYAPCAGPRFKAAIVISSTESILNSGIDDGDDLSQTWIAPALIAKVWDTAFNYVLDPANGDAKGKLDPAAGSVMGELADEVFAMYVIAHGEASDKPGPDVLTGPLDGLVAADRKVQRVITDPADQEMLAWFVTRVENLKKRVGGEMTAAYVARPAVAKLITDFVVAVNANDQQALAKLLTPEGAKAAGKVGDLSSALFNNKPVKDIKVFFVAAAGSDGSGEPDEHGRYQLNFYLQATDAKDGHTRYAYESALITKDNGDGRIHEIFLVFDPEDTPAKSHP